MNVMYMLLMSCCVVTSFHIAGVAYKQGLEVSLSFIELGFIALVFIHVMFTVLFNKKSK